MLYQPKAKTSTQITWISQWCVLRIALIQWLAKWFTSRVRIVLFTVLVHAAHCAQCRGNYWLLIFGPARSDSVCYYCLMLNVRKVIIFTNFWTSLVLWYTGMICTSVTIYYALRKVTLINLNWQFNLLGDRTYML